MLRRDPPPWLTYIAAIVMLAVIFVTTYFAVAFLAGLACGASLRFYPPLANFSCKVLPPFLLGLVYFGVLVTCPMSIRALRRLFLRGYRPRKV